jgi:hypothetical protein
MSDALPLGLDAVDLLLSITESPGMAISATALHDFHKEAGPALLAAGAIKPDGFEAVTVSQADLDDAIVSLTWSSELGGYAYFSPTAGVVRIDDDNLRRFRLDTSWFLQWIARHLGSGAGAHAVCLFTDRFWDLGDIWLGATKRMRRRTAVYFARRLIEFETVTQIATVLRVHRPRASKVILTTTNDLDLARTIISDHCTILPIRTCDRAGIKHFELDSNIIYSAAHGLRTSCSEMPVQVEAGFRMVAVGDRQFRFLGDKQRQVVGFLYQRWRNGDGPISASAMFEELEFSNTTRLRDLFKDHSNWRELIGYKNGACWLRCEELLAESGPIVDRP